MKRLRLRLSEAAAGDILEQSDWYAQQADVRLSQRWEKAVSSTLLRLLRYPRSGASCSFSSRELRRVRRMPVPGFAKHLIFYTIENDKLLILRVVHGARDLESLF